MIGGVVVGIERFVLVACADLARLASEMCLGGTSFERSQETIRLAARSVQQRCSIPRGVGVTFWCGRLAGGTEPSAAGGGIVPRNLRVCTRGPQGCAAGNFCPAALTISC